MNLPIVRLALRSLFGRARVLALIAFPVVLLALALLRRQAGSGSLTRDDALSMLSTFGLGIAVPIVTLVATTTLINSEFDDGSIIYLLTKPVSRTSIVLSKAVVVLGTVLIFAALPMAIAAVVMNADSRGALAALAGGAVSGAAYVGIFLVLATFLKRSIVGCLLYWLLWESTLRGLIPAIKWLSAHSWGSSVLRSVGELGGTAVPAWYAVAAACVCLVGGILLAGQRLRSTTISDV